MAASSMMQKARAALWCRDAACYGLGGKLGCGGGRVVRSI
jgi:hypothetical protein